ncbi:MAG TPA: class I SAM-dependent methyltransferase [Gemmatimonadales bacterium]|nr:class I SAM-dependent methyltransferase [Gemmatimonadales bacterium]
MIDVKAQTTGTAGVQGDLWSARARDWAEVQEDTVLPLYLAVLERVGVRTGTRLLDAGCGSGRFAQLGTARGAIVTGLDAAPAVVAIARERLPDRDIRVGELEDLPWADGSFDVVTGFNSFQYAANPAVALREARRVALPGAQVVIAIWGEPDSCEAAAYVRTLGRLGPPAAPGAPGPFALSAPGALERLAADAGFTDTQAFDVECTWRYADLETALRGLLSTGPAARAMRHSGEEAARRAVTEAIAPFRTTQGSYQIENIFRYVVAR